jgi:hypothetical protein
VTRRAIRITVLSLLWVLGLAVIAGAAGYWRLSQGPISLAFVGNTIEDAINKQLGGMRIKLGEAELELDQQSRTPSVRARNLVLYGADGEILASAPKAGVTLDKSRILRGTVSVTSLELIGPKVSARLNLDGSVSLGIESEGASPEQEVFVDITESDSADALATQKSAPTPTKPPLSGGRLLELLDKGGETGALSKLQEVRISRGSLRFYDEANDATWTAPEADLAFKRVESGFVIAAKASVATGSGEPWKMEGSATYRRAQKNYTANVAIENVVLANVAEKVFALSQFARVSLPFSGFMEIELAESGEISSAKGELFAGKGRIGLPEYIAKAIDVNEASMRISYGGNGTPLEINESSILIEGLRADVRGSFLPQRAEDGRLTSIGFKLKSENARVDTGNESDDVFVDRVEFSGNAFVEQQRLDIDDLVVMSSNTGVRLRGVITGGEKSPGINVAGRMRDVSAGLLKKLWPPVLTPKTRTWINENVQSGRITDGTFQVNFPPNVLAQAQAAKQLPSNVVDVRFTMESVQSRYFKGLPILQQASGEARLKDDVFSLQIDKGFVLTDSGSRVTVDKGTFSATELLSGASPGTFSFDVSGPVPSLLDYASHPDLKLATGEIDKFPKIGGKAEVNVGLKFPLIKGVPRSEVRITTEVKLIDAELKSIMQGVDLTDGDFTVQVKPESVSVAGPAKLNGVPAKITWVKPRKGGAARSEVETVMDAKLRAKFGVKLDEYMTGNIPVKAVIVGDGSDRVIDIEADLSDAAMKVSAAGWSRSAVPGTRATFRLTDQGNGIRTVEDLRLDGKGLRVRGMIKLKPGGFQLIDLDEIRLSEDDVFAARLEPSDDAMNLTLSGNTFDARPYIKNLISPAKPVGEASGSSQKGPKFIVNARMKAVTAHRGESLRNVRGTFVARGSQITTATIEGEFESGLPLTIRLTPTDGGREMRITTSDGGAAIRASNFYSKIAGGELEFYALMANAPGSPIRNGRLELKRFSVRNEAALAELDDRGRPKKSGPRVDGVTFKRLELPFTTDGQFVRLCKVSLRGPEIGFTANGLIRKKDGAIDITGAYFPLHGLNRALSEIPLFGDILTGGRGEGVLGLTYAMGGTVAKPKYQINPLSFIAPGVFRKLFEYEQTACRTSGKRASAGN